MCSILDAIIPSTNWSRISMPSPRLSWRRKKSVMRNFLSRIHAMYRCRHSSKSKLLKLSSFQTQQQQLLLHPFNGLLSTTTWVSHYQKGKTSLGLNKARDDRVWGCSGISWTICRQSAPCSRQITTPTPHHSCDLHKSVTLFQSMHYRRDPLHSIYNRRQFITLSVHLSV